MPEKNDCEPMLWKILEDTFKAIRRKGYGELSEKYEAALYDTLGWSQFNEEVEKAILTKSIHKLIGRGIEADILLMVFGLLPGCEKDNITDRRKFYLQQSNFLEELYKDRNEAAGDEDEVLRLAAGRLHRTYENPLISRLAKSLAKRMADDPGFVKDLKGYIKKVKLSESGKFSYCARTLPPSYLGEKPDPKLLFVLDETADILNYQEQEDDGFSGSVEEILTATSDIKQTVIESTELILQRLEAHDSSMRELLLTYYCPAPAPGFVGREDELRDMEARLNHYGRVLLSGIAGIGKTELVKRFAQSRAANYDTICYLSYEESLAMTIYNQLPVSGFSPDEKDIISGYRNKMNMLRRYDERALLIIDDFETYVADDNCRLAAVFDPQYTEMCSGRYHLIIVSTMTADECLVLTPLPETQQLELFRWHYKRSLSYGEELKVRALLKRMDGHTLSIALFAKNLFLDRGKSINRTIEQIIADNRSTPKALSSALTPVFDVSSLTDSEKNIMVSMALTPYDGISVSQFGEWTDLDKFDDLQKLIDSNWIQIDIKKDFISLQPIISDFVTDGLKPDSSKCAKYLDSLILFSGCEENACSPEKRKYSAALIKSATSKITDEHIFNKLLRNNIRYNYSYSGKPQGWGPERETFLWADRAPYRTMNSITDNPAIGDERNFVRVRKVGDPKFVNGVVVEAGACYEASIFFHNNASSTLNKDGSGIADGVRVSSILHEYIAAGHKGYIYAKITAANTKPVSVWDATYVCADEDVFLRYIPGSIYIHSNGPVNGEQLSKDNLFRSGVNICYWDTEKARGVLPGGNEYSGYISFKFRADKPGFEMDKHVSRGDRGEWVKSLPAEPDDIVSFRIRYRNTGTTEQNDVVVMDVLPDGLEYLSGTTWLVNGSSPNGNYVVDGLLGKGLNIGRCQPGSEATVIYKTRLPDNSGLDCDSNIFTSKATVVTANGSKEDWAEVTVTGVLSGTDA